MVYPGIGELSTQHNYLRNNYKIYVHVTCGCTVRMKQVILYKMYSATNTTYMVHKEQYMRVHPYPYNMKTSSNQEQQICNNFTITKTVKFIFYHKYEIHHSFHMQRLPTHFFSSFSTQRLIYTKAHKGRLCT